LSKKIENAFGGTGESMMNCGTSATRPPLLIEKIDNTATVPTRSYPTDSGLDLYAHDFSGLGAEYVDLSPGGTVLVGTGIKATVGPGYEIQVRPRSGLALKHGITVLNTPGTVDEQYRGEICVILINLSRTTQRIQKGDRVAQMVVCPVVLADPVVVPSLPSTPRGAGGFGSTGSA